MHHIINKTDMLKEYHNEMGISRATSKGKVGNLGYGYYCRPPKPILELDNDSTIKQIKLVMGQFPVKPNFCAFSAQSLNFCINHLITSNTYIVEVEKNYLENTFAKLKTNFKNVVLFKPNERDRYNYWDKNAIYVYELFSRAPTKDGGMTIEKLIIDLLFNSNIRSLYTRQDVLEAIDVLCNKYQINYQTLFSFATRKNKFKELISVISAYLPSQIKKEIL